MKNKLPEHHGFTLIELLAVIAVIGILAAILIPSVGAVRIKAAQAASASDMRQIFIAHANYQTDGSRARTMATGSFSAEDGTNRANTPADFAKVLAWNTEMNEAALFFINNAEDVSSMQARPRVIFTGKGADRELDEDFSSAEGNISYEMARLRADPPSTMPLMWTKGLQADGTWSADPMQSPWGSSGGHVIFAKGNVEFFKEIRNGDLRDPEGQAIVDIDEAFSSSNRILRFTE